MQTRASSNEVWIPRTGMLRACPGGSCRDGISAVAFRPLRSFAPLRQPARRCHPEDGKLGSCGMDRGLERRDDTTTTEPWKDMCIFMERLVTRRTPLDDMGNVATMIFNENRLWRQTVGFLHGLCRQACRPATSVRLREAIAWSYGGQWRQSTELIHRAHASGGSIKFVVCRRLVEAMSRRQWQHALSAIRSLRRWMPVEIESYKEICQAALRACSRGGVWQQTVQAYSECVWAGCANPADPRVALAACLHPVSEAGQSRSRRGPWLAACWILRTALSSGGSRPDAVLWGMTAKVLQGEWEQMAAVLDLARRSGFSALGIRSHRREGTGARWSVRPWASALTVWHEPSESGMRLDVLDSLAATVRTYSVRTEWARAYSRVARLVRRQPFASSQAAALQMERLPRAASRLMRALRFVWAVERLGLPLDAALGNVAVNLFVGGKRWDGAPALLAAVLPALVPPGASSVSPKHAGATRATSMRGRSDEASPADWDCIEYLRFAGVQANTASYNVVISTVGPVHWRTAGFLVSRMRCDCIPSDLFTMSSVMLSCLRGGLWKLVFDVFRSHSRESLEPDTLAYSVAVNACRECPRWEVAGNLYVRALSGAVTTDSVILNSALSVLDRALLWRSALAVQRSTVFSAIEADIVTCSTLISACARCTRWEDVVGLLAGVPAVGLSPTVLTCASSAGACITSGNWQAGAQVINELRSLSLEPSIVSRNVAMGGGGRSGWSSGHLEVAFEHSAPFAETEEWQPGGLWEWALGRTATDLVGGYVLDGPSWSVVASKCIGLSQWRWGLRTLGDMQLGQVRPSSVSYGAAALAYAEGAASAVWSQWSCLLCLWDSALHRASAVSVAACSTMMGACQVSQQWELVFGFLESASRVGLKLDVAGCCVVLQACKPTAKSAHHWGLAAATLQRMGGEAMDADSFAYNVGASSCAASSQWRLAREVLKSAVTRGKRADAVSCSVAVSAHEVSSCIGERVLWCGALEVLWGARWISIQPAAIHVNLAVSSCGKCHEWVAAISLLAVAYEWDLRLNAITFDAAILACERGQRWVQALALLDDMVRHAFKPGPTLLRIVVDLCDASGQKALARRLLIETEALVPTALGKMGM